MRDFQSLIVWQRAHELSLGVYRAVASFPASERFELSAQLRRAAVSVEANIAEGCGHSSDREVARFFQIAMASASEAHCEILLARDLQLIVDGDARHLVGLLNEVQRMLTVMITRLRRHPRRLRKSDELTTND